MSDVILNDRQQDLIVALFNMMRLQLAQYRREAVPVVHQSEVIENDMPQLSAAPDFQQMVRINLERAESGLPSLYSFDELSRVMPPCSPSRINITGRGTP